MTITGEECAELAQVCAKILRKYSQKDEISKEWQDKLIEESGDVYAMLELMVENGYLTWDDIHRRTKVKREKLKKWSKLLND